MRILWLIIISLLLTSFNSKTVPQKEVILSVKTSSNISYPLSLYQELELEGVLDFKAFEEALLGMEVINPENKNILSVIDFTLPSTEKRMVVLDLENKKVLFHTIVSHGRNSGQKYATSFSNRHGSYQSSLGFYLTENTYQGANGYSLRLDGLEKGINDQAKPRAIVIHGADYCSETVIKSTGRLGRSYGCPALPRELNKPIINTIKDGTLLYIYADNQDYITSSEILAKQNRFVAQHSVANSYNTTIR